ncbi:MAG: iditol 2-dehydrogenase [Rhodospirillaceae bacterium]|nr:iditol 2-dehydrogenase [Rhodospirillaceae bacterium]
MKGIVFVGNRQVELQDFDDPTPGPGEVVLEMKASGMCGSDLHVYRSPGGGPAAAAALGLGGEGTSVIGGHEPCGVVAARGPEVSEAQAPIGARVMVHHYKGCGGCPSCRQGWSQLCADGFTVYGITGHGGHAPYMKVPASTLVSLPEELSFEEGAAISCGTGTAFGALKRMDMPGGVTLAVFGQGPVGLSATLLAVAMGARVIAVDVNADRLALAKQMGADETVDASATDPITAIRGMTRGRGADYTLECSGNPDARAAAVRSTRTWGTTCFVGEGNSVTLDVSPDILRRQLTLIGSWTFNTIGQDDCARFIAEHEVPLKQLISHRFRQDQAAEAYTLFDTQTTGKGVFLF